MGDMGDFWRDVRAASREHKAIEVPRRVAEIEALRDHGYTVRALNYGSQFRINQQLDLYPTRRRFHALRLNRRGTYRSALECARTFIVGGG